MSTVEAYVNRPALRKRYFELNDIKYVSCWEITQHRYNDGRIEGFEPALCSAPGVGLPEHNRVFNTPEEVQAWAEKYCPELLFVPYSED